MSETAKTTDELEREYSAACRAYHFACRKIEVATAEKAAAAARCEELEKSLGIWK